MVVGSSQAGRFVEESIFKVKDILNSMKEFIEKFKDETGRDLKGVLVYSDKLFEIGNVDEVSDDVIGRDRDVAKWLKMYKTVPGKIVVNENVKNALNISLEGHEDKLRKSNSREKYYYWEW